MGVDVRDGARPAGDRPGVAPLVLGADSLVFGSLRRKCYQRTFIPDRPCGRDIAGSTRCLRLPRAVDYVLASMSSRVRCLRVSDALVTADGWVPGGEIGRDSGGTTGRVPFVEGGSGA